MIGNILFIALGLIAVMAALGMLTSTNAVHSALFLVINFVCIALFYLGLDAPFLAMVQITVYAGAIMVLFVFVIMLLGAERVSLESKLRWQTPLAIFLALALMVVTGIVFFSNAIQAGESIKPIMETSQVERFGSPHQVGLKLFSDYLLPFEMTGVLLLVAMIGAVVLAKDDKKVHPTAADKAK
jgi:NADH-quinone oxidoreductase subunit J